MSDADAIQRSRDDPAAFEAVFDRHFAELHRYLHRRVGRDIADDLAAEVFEVAFRRRKSFDPAYADARPWLYGIAHNALRRHHRTEVRRLRAYARLQPDRPNDDLENVAARLDARGEGPRLATALASLKRPDRETLLLFAWADLSYHEIAQALGVPAGTVRSRLNRARTKLREQLRPNGQGHVAPALVPNDERTW